MTEVTESADSEALKFRVAEYDGKLYPHKKS
jgi:hypothetical protein